MIEGSDNRSKSRKGRNDADATSTKDGSKRNTRRKHTRRALDARYDKHLADRNSCSRLDPSEPSLVGLPANAIDSAAKIVKRSRRKGQTPKAKVIARRVAAISNLAPAQEKALCTWLSWMIDRPWILLDPDRSTAIEWVKSEPPYDEIWTEELAASWRSKIDSKFIAVQNGQAASQPRSSPSDQSDVRAVKAENLPRPSEQRAPSTATNSALPLSHPLPIGDQPAHSGSSVQTGGSPTLPAAPAQGGEPVRSVKPDPAKIPAAPSQSPSALPPASPAMADGSSPSGSRRETFEGKTIVIPEFPTFFFKAGAHKTNALLNAMKPNSFNEQAFRAAINVLLHHKAELNEFCERGSQQRNFIKDLFTQIGMKLP